MAKDKTPIQPDPSSTDSFTAPIGNEKRTEKESLLPHHRVTYTTAVRLRVAAICVSWVSLIFSLVTGVISIVWGVQGRSQALMAYGLEALLDAISSVVVLWRFHGSSKSLYSARRERLACIVIGWLFIVAAACLIGRSIQSLLNNTEESEAKRLWIVSLVDGSVTTGLAATKLGLGLQLESRSLVTDSVITFTGAFTSFGTVLGLALFERFPDLWYVDAIVAMLCGTFLLGYGLKLLIQLMCCYKGEAEETEDSLELK